MKNCRNIQNTVQHRTSFDQLCKQYSYVNLVNGKKMIFLFQKLDANNCLEILNLYAVSRSVHQKKNWDMKQSETEPNPIFHQYLEYITPIRAGKSPDACIWKIRRIWLDRIYITALGQHNRGRGASVIQSKQGAVCRIYSQGYLQPQGDQGETFERLSCNAVSFCKQVWKYIFMIFLVLVLQLALIRKKS